MYRALWECVIGGTNLARSSQKTYLGKWRLICVWYKLCSLHPKFMCQSLNSLNLRMWLYLEVRPLKRWLRQNEALGWALIQFNLCPYNKREFDHTEETPGMDTQKKDQVKTQRRWLSGRQGERPQEKPNLPTLWSWTSSVQHCENINFFV